jgi:hypothetical protein
MKERIRLRRDSYQQWYANNPVLGTGEPAVESNSNRVKIGDGVSNWRDLPYLFGNLSGLPVSIGDGYVTSLIFTLDERLNIVGSGDTTVSFNDATNTITIDTSLDPNSLNYPIIVGGLGYVPQATGNYASGLHYHSISHISGLQTALSGKQPTGNYTLIGHKHNISDISGLINQLASKQPIGSYSPLVHDHVLKIGDGKHVYINYSTNDTLNIVGGTGTLIGYDENTNTITISSVGGGAGAITNLDSFNIVYTSGNQNISGNKNFNDYLQFNNGFGNITLQNDNGALRIDVGSENYALGPTLATFDVNFSSNSGSFTALTVGNTGVSLIGHSHMLSDIKDFGSGISGFIKGTGIGSIYSGFIPRWINGSGLSNSKIYQKNNNIGIGYTDPAYELQISGTVVADYGILGGLDLPSAAFADNNYIYIDSHDLHINTETNYANFYDKLIVSGSNVNVGGSLKIDGNLTVNGTTVANNVDTLVIEDPIITLGLSSGNIIATDTFDRGLALIRSSGLAAFMGWDTSANQFVMLSSGTPTNNSGNYSAGTYGNLQISNLNSFSGIFTSGITANEGIFENLFTNSIGLIGDTNKIFLTAGTGIFLNFYDEENILEISADTSVAPIGDTMVLRAINGDIFAANGHFSDIYGNNIYSTGGVHFAINASAGMILNAHIYNDNYLGNGLNNIIIGLSNNGYGSVLDEYAPSYNFLCIGSNNKFKDSSKSFIIGNNSSSISSNNSIAIGNNALISNSGQMSYSNGKFQYDGDSQKITYLARGVTIDDNSCILTLDGNTISNNNIFLVPAETTWAFYGQISAYDYINGYGAAFNIRGGIRRNQYDETKLIGSFIKESWIEPEIENIYVSITANDTDKTLQLEAFGKNGSSIKWTCELNIIQNSNSGTL